MRKILGAFILLIIGFGLKGQSVLLIDESTNAPLEYVTIAHIATQTLVNTNENGVVEISKFKGLDSIEVRLLGYDTRYLSYKDFEANNYRITLPPAQIELDQVIVSASKWGQTKREVPARVSTITAEEVAFQNPQTAADLLASSGEVFVQKSQLGGGSPMIRGFSTNRLLISIDGVRMNNAIFRSGNLQNVISLDPLATESAEVLFGPGSVIYGSDAIGGVMSFSSLKPWLSFDESTRVASGVMARYATANNEKSVHGHVKLGWQKWALVTSLSFSDFDDLRMGKNGGPDSYLRDRYVERVDGIDMVVQNAQPLVQTESGYSQMNIMQKVRFQPNKYLNFVYSFHHSETSDVPRYDRLIRPQGANLRSAEWYYGPQKWQMHHLDITVDEPSSLYDKISLKLAQQNYEESRHDRDLNSEIRSERFEKVNALSANLDAYKTVQKNDKIYYGLEAVHNKVTSSAHDLNILTAALMDAPARYPNSDWYSLAAYTTYQKSLGEKTTFQGGVRYNYIGLKSDFNQSFFPLPFDEARVDNGALTGSLGVVYAPNQKWLWRGSVSTGFRSPNVDDVGKIFDSEPGAVVVPNPDLKPEYAYNAEASFNYNWKKGNSLFVNGYYTQLTNALVRRDFQLNGQDSIIYQGELSQVQSIQNAANANVFGIEFGADFKFGSGIGGKIRYNYQKGEEELDDGSVSASRHAPPPFGSVHLTYERSKWLIDLSGQFNAEVPFEKIPVSERRKTYIYAEDENGNPFTPGFAVFNIRGKVDLTDQWTLNVALENILDKRYRPYSSGIVAPGRNLVVSVMWRIE